MNTEKYLLKQDLNKQETAEEVNKFIEDTELMGGNEDIVELAKQRLQEIQAKASSAEKTSEVQVLQVENMGGNQDEVSNRVKEVDQKIEEAKAEATKKVEAAKNGKKEISRDLLKIGSVFNYKTSKGDIIEVKLISEIQKTNEPNPREYVRVKATNGTLETDLLISDLVEQEKTIDNKNEAEVAKENLSNILGNNAFNDSIDYSKGIEQKKYPDEPNKTYFNLYLNQNDIQKAKNFLDLNKINTYQWVSKDRIQIWVESGTPSAFR